MNCDNEAIAWVEERGCLLPKTKPVKIPPTPPRISEQINLDPDFCLSWNTSSTGANDLVRSNVKKAPAKVRTREAKKRDKAYGKRKPFVGRRSVNRIVAIRVLPSTESPEVGGQKVTGNPRVREKPIDPFMASLPPLKRKKHQTRWETNKKRLSSQGDHTTHSHHRDELPIAQGTS